MVLEAINTSGPSPGVMGAGCVRSFFVHVRGRARLGGHKYKEVCPGTGVCEFFYGGKGTGWSHSRRIVVVRQSLKQSGDKAQ